MKPRLNHSWDLDYAAAREFQVALAPTVSRENAIPEAPRLIAGVDISGAERGAEALGAVVVVSYPELELVEVRTAKKAPLIPYIPGLLSFREIPVLLDAFERLESVPDFILCDGHGMAHPRRFGLACHLGMVLDIPSIGCAKSILAGAYQGLAQEAGSTAPLIDRGEVVGLALRTQEGKTPVFVSIGHKVDLAAATRWVLACVTRYRLPEPARLAHLAASGRVAGVVKGSRSKVQGSGKL